MAEQDGYVQVAADGVGKKIDNAELTREPLVVSYHPDGTAALVVYRQRVSLASDDNPRQQVEVTGEEGRGKLEVHARSADDMYEVLCEIRDMLKLLMM